MVRRYESRFYGEPVGPVRHAIARLRRACGAAHSDTVSVVSNKPSAVATESQTERGC